MWEDAPEIHQLICNTSLAYQKEINEIYQVCWLRETGRKKIGHPSKIRQIGAKNTDRYKQENK